MENFLQAFILAFREGLEAFLIIVILLQFLTCTKNISLKKQVWYGTLTGVLGSGIIGLLLFILSSHLNQVDATAKLWESVASFIAVILITTFIVWMIKHSNNIREHIQNKAALNLSKKGIFLLSMVMVLREGAEIAIFSFAGKYTLLPILLGLSLSIVLVFLLSRSLVKVKLSTIFRLTLIYLVLQAGFLMGYSIHEGLSGLKASQLIDAQNPLLTKAFDLSDTILYHKEGILGLPLYVLVGWYSTPEWIQLIIHYGYIILLFIYWKKKRTLQS